MTIGNWVRRRRQKWHLVDSTVAGDAFTRCGRRMDRVLAGVHDSLANRTLQVSEVMPLTRMIGQPQLCKAGCDAQAKKDLVETLLEDGERDRALVAAWDSTLPAIEDDPSTSPVDPVTGMP